VKKNIFSIFIFLFGFFQVFSLPSFAIATAIPIMQPVHQPNPTLFGENQYYTVTFRGNGEAVVNMKAILTNTTDTPLSSLMIHIPTGIAIDNVVAYQVIAQPQCIQYNYQQQPTTKPTCLQYQPPNYQYVGPDTTYQKISLSQKNNIIHVLLPTAIKANDTGSYLLSYRSFTYTKQNFFGAYDVMFQTLKVEDSINSLQVGITTDSDLYLKDAKGNVNYAAPSTGMMAIARSTDTTAQNQQFTDFYNQIGQGIITKSASQLEPMESYTVKDTYADTGMKLYGQEIAITVFGILIFLTIVTLVAVLLLRHRTVSTKSTSLKLFFMAAGVSFVSIFLASLYTLGILIFFMLAANNSYLYYTNSMLFLLLLMAVSGAVYLFLIFIPTVVMMIKKGILWGCITFGLTIMWMVIAGIILFGFFYLFSASSLNNYSNIRPLMMSGQSSVSPTVVKQ